ncbi:HAD family hydrolase [Pseudoalteromonas piratica]|uniref:Phosphatase n=1 Tax=Pseudoalteromonas piratica TaxID=1348114 RepID=A0A0A7EKK5_9GAMM|nr:HAD family hydrolase [Pseudoalteromonas piratica]AIY67154.1 phosphatase [Pseudoalteromonas piratica]
MNHIKGIIFDLDGTLVSCDLCFKTMREAIGCPLEEDILAFVESLSNEQQIIANQVIRDLELKDAHSAAWISGAKEFIDYLNQCNLPLAIVTRNSKEPSDIKITNNAIAIETIITRDDAPAKPDPTAILNLSSKWQIDPRDILYIGDYLHDINIAKNAGALSALFCEKEIPNYANQADYVFTCYAELLERFKASA